MNDMTIYDARQAAFNTVCIKLHAQGGKSMIDASCAYVSQVQGCERGCAVGVLLSDEEKDFFRNHSTFNTKGLSIMILENGILTRFGGDVEFMQRLQLAHDTADEIEGAWVDIWSGGGIAKRLQDLAVDYDLNAEVLYKTFGYPL